MKMKYITIAALILSIAGCVALKIPDVPEYYDYPATAIYWSTEGNDANDGLSAVSPVATLTRALAIHAEFPEVPIYLSGDFRSTNNISPLMLYNVTHVTIVGGWNRDFTAIDSCSLFYASVSNTRPAIIMFCNDVVVSNVVFTGGNFISLYGGGIMIANATNITLSGIVTNNDANRGGGIGIIDCQSIHISCLVADNVSTAGSGGGIYLTNSYYCTITGTAASNYTAQNGGGIYIAGSRNTVDAAVVSNVSLSGSIGGGGIHIAGSSNTVSGNILSNYAQAGGGGIYLDGDNNSVNAVISHNFAGTGGGGILMQGDYNVISGTLTHNIAGSFGGGGLCIGYTRYSTISGIVANNNAIGGGSGGGIYAFSCVSNIFSGEIYRNFATQNGGGIYLYCVTNSTISATVASNVATNSGMNGYGGGIFANYCVSNIYSSIICFNRGHWGGGIELDYGKINTIAGSVYCNYSYSVGGGIRLLSPNTIISAIITNNTANGYGGGITIESANSNTITGACRIINNHCDYTNAGNKLGGGIYITVSPGNRIQSGCVYSPNYRASTLVTGMNVTNIYTNAPGQLTVE